MTNNNTSEPECTDDFPSTRQIYAVQRSTKMTNNNTSEPECTDDFPSTRQIYAELGDDVSVIVLTAVVGVLSLVTVAIILESVWYLIYNVKNKSRRVKMICLMALYPVVSITSLHSLLVPTSTLISDFAASIYLSFCLLLFVHLIIHYFGGDQEILKALKDTTIDFNTPPCCCCCLCLRKVEFNKRSLKIVKLMVLQVAVVRPIVLFIAAALWTDGYYIPSGEADPESPTMYINLLNAASTLFAIYGMMVTYRGTASRLTMYRLRPKFLSLQLSILCLNLQSTILSIIAVFAVPPCSGTRGSRVRASRFHHFLLIIEFFMLAILARFAYRRPDTAVPNTDDDHVTENGDHVTENGENVTPSGLKYMHADDKQKHNSNSEHYTPELQTYL